MSGVDWPTETIAACLERVDFPGIKVQTKDYQKQGAYPIIDQGQNLIAGWTNDPEGLISKALPIVVFGDHTRVFKYVDFPFVRGADGTQLLKPKADIDPLYFFYACRALNLASRGYNRHFSLLREQFIPLPSPDEQRLIGKVLRQVEEAVRVQEAQIHTGYALKQAALRQLFTHGLRGAGQRDTEFGPVPNDWHLLPIGDLGRIVTGTTPPTADAENYVHGRIPFVAPGDFEHGSHIGNTAKVITERGLQLSRPIPAETTCFVCIGSTIGKVGLTTAEVCSTNQQINAIVPSQDYDGRFVFHLLTYWSEYVQRQASPSPVPILSKGAFAQVEIFATRDTKEQEGIAAVLDALDAKVVLQNQKRDVETQLFGVLLNKLLSGDVRAATLDLSRLNGGALSNGLS